MQKKPLEKKERITVEAHKEGHLEKLCVKKLKEP